MIVLVQLAYLSGAICFILGLRGLSHPSTARRGNLLAALGMALAILGALLQPIATAPNNYLWIAGAMIGGAAIGWYRAAKVEMTGMPQLVSLFNGLGGGSAMLLALTEYIKNYESSSTSSLAVIAFTLLVGALSFSGSILAYLKLDGKVRDAQVRLPAHSVVNLGLLLLSIVLTALLVLQPSIIILIISIIVFLIYGFSFVAPIGGADMPVVISLLNSVTGLSAATAGFLYGSQIMILGGILVGASGTILTILMCQAMNRSLMSVILGNFGSAAIASAPGADEVDQTVQSAQVMDVAILLAYAQKVVLVPGYGMAVAQAQKQAKELDDLLQEKDIEVYYGIHPVAGRMPGHMNVLLAEVDIDYDKLYDLDQTNGIIDEADVVLVVGANDVVNPSAIDDPSSSIYGMPVLEVWKAQQVIVFKRSMKPGYAGIQNPLFFKENTKMLFGDAADSLKKIIAEIKNL